MINTPNQESIQQNDTPRRGSKVELRHEMSYGETIDLNLKIPDYQRIYCWEAESVTGLLNDVLLTEKPYRLGTIILHEHDGIYDIIDGQQRLVTLTLLLQELGESTPLLLEKFSSGEAIAHIGYNKFLISEHLKKHRTRPYPFTIDILKRYIKFSVLILQNSSLDLAYTFFSNQNTRGVPLSDYDLLKAHHIKFIRDGQFSKAERSIQIFLKPWNEAMSKPTDDKESEPDYVRTLDTFLSRLRLWMRNERYSEKPYRIKKEYEAAPLFDDRCWDFTSDGSFYRHTGRGYDFFSFFEEYIKKYTKFKETNVYMTLRDNFQGGTSSDKHYRDVIAALLFCYFITFNDFSEDVDEDAYRLPEALCVIMRVVLQHRYETGRATKESIINNPYNAKLVCSMIRAEFGPDTFLAEAYAMANGFSIPTDIKGIRTRMKKRAKVISLAIDNRVSTNKSFKELNL